MADTPDVEHVPIDGTIAKAHADATGAKRREAVTIGRSPGSLTTRLHAAVDAVGLPLRICPTPGRGGDNPQARALLAGLEDVGHVIADAAYDADLLRAFIADELGAAAPIRPIRAAPESFRSTGASTRNAIRSNASKGSSASAASPCAEVPALMGSSTSPTP